MGEAAGHRVHGFFRLAAYTGGRRGGILHLRWADVDLDAAEIRFGGFDRRCGRQADRRLDKGGRSRVVGIDQGTMQVLERHRLAQEGDRSLAGPECVVSDRVFTSRLGHVIHPDTFTWLMYKLIRAHNEPKTLARRNHPSEPLPPPARQLPMIRLHDLKHLHATLLLLEGVQVHVVANRLGHSDPSVTWRVDAQVLRESASGVADIFARLWNGLLLANLLARPVSKTTKPAGQVSDAGLWWPGAGSNRRPSDFQSDARTN